MSGRAEAGPDLPAASIEIGRAGEHLELRVDGVSYSTFHAERPWSGWVWDTIAATVLLVPSPAPRVLLLGCGGGTVLALLRRLRPRARLTAVEKDPRVLRLARRRFRLDELGAEVVEGDGVEYLLHGRRRFHLVIDDMFGPSAEGLVRPVEDEEEQLRRLARRLRPGGVAVTNSTTDDDPPGLEAALRRAYRRTFRHRLALTPRLGLNVVLAGSEGPLDAAAVRTARGLADPADRGAVLDVLVKKA